MVPKAPLTRDYTPTFVEIVDGESVIYLLTISLTEDIEVFISMTETAGCDPRERFSISQGLS